MTVEEFNLEFDTLYNNISSNQAPGLNTYEKSVFLTKAQEELLKNYFNPKGNKYLEGFDDNEKRQVDFSKLIKVSELSPATPSTGFVKFNKSSLVFEAPTDVLLCLNESLEEVDVKEYSSMPIAYREYQRLTSKPYAFPLRGKAWRLLHSEGTTLYYEVVARVSASTSTFKYVVRYLKKPAPIIIEALTGDYQGLLINGIATKSECELDASLHREILTRAVELAKIAFADDAEVLKAGQRTE